MSEEKKNENDTKKLLEMSLDDIAKMNNEKRKRNKNQNKFPSKNNYRNNNNNKRQNKYKNNNRRIRGGNHFKRKYNNNYKSHYNKFDKFENTKKNKSEKETRTKIQITNLQKEIKDDELNKFCSTVGKIKSCVIQKDENNNSLGIADIEYFNPESAKEAVKNFDNAEIEGTFMKVQFKNE